MPPNKIKWPPPADAQAALRLRETFSGLGAAAQKFCRTGNGAALLDCLGGNAPYLADLAVKEHDCVLAATRNGPDAAFAAVMADLKKSRPRETRPALARRLRKTKHRAALIIALADLGGAWRLERITAALSELAEAALRAAIRHLLRALHDAGTIRLPHPARPEQDSGFIALGLGKLGAAELNYSSDIDLVLLYDSESPVYSGEAQPVQARFARDLVALLSQRDEHGYVFRVDLRLRPDPGATPPVISLATALAYYESHGRTWERAAFSKARPVAGDLVLGQKFLSAIRPFIWRKNLDFAAIADIHDMKRRIDAGQDHGLPGFDVKLGRGGIREIEFFVQTLSLVWGGQEPALRIPATMPALRALAKAGHVPATAARQLATDYRKLRKVEHRLQMIADRQTHALPATDEALQSFSTFLNEPDFPKTFPKLLRRVHAHFLGFFDAGDAPDQQYRIEPGAEGPPPPAFSAHLSDLGFTDQKHLTERLRAWTGGEVPALRSERARVLLDAVIPKLLAALGRQPDPDRAFIRFDTMLSRQRAGVQLLSLFARSPMLLDRLAAVLGAAPALAEHLAQDSQALETLLAPTARFASPKPLLRRMLRDAAGLEDAIGITRRFVRREDFHLSVSTLEGRLDTDEAGRLRSDLAQAALSALLPIVIETHMARHGKVRGFGFAVVALGKAGGGEMLAASDLDLMLIYDHAPAAAAPVPYFVRLSHAFTTVLTAQGPEGALYKVDMRLRPSGNQGPVAVSRAAFRRYHEMESWTWERLALTRARVMAATPGFGAVVEAEITRALAREQAAAQIRANAVAMRDRVAGEFYNPVYPFDVKYRVGGMIELAFIPEVLQLIHGPKNPALFQPNTAGALRALGAAGHLPAEHAKMLIEADHFWRTIQGINRITGLGDRTKNPQPAMLAPLLRATGQPDLATLIAAMDQAGQNVRDCFIHHIGVAPDEH